MGDKNVNNANKMSEYRVNVDMTVKIALYINARSDEEAVAKAEEILYEHSIPAGATGLDIDDVYCNISSAVDMNTRSPGAKRHCD